MIHWRFSTLVKTACWNTMIQLQFIPKASSKSLCHPFYRSQTDEDLL